MSHLSVVDDQLEEGVHQQDAIWQDAAAVQENRLKKHSSKKIISGGHHEEAPSSWSGSRRLGRASEGCEADLWWSVEGVRVEDGLDHDEGLGEVLPDEVVPVIGRLIWAVVEHLQERRPPQVEHELRERRGYQHGRISLTENKTKCLPGDGNAPEGRETETLTV